MKNQLSSNQVVVISIIAGLTAIFGIFIGLGTTPKTLGIVAVSFVISAIGTTAVLLTENECPESTA